MCVISLFWLMFVEIIFLPCDFEGKLHQGSCLITYQKRAEGNHVKPDFVQ